MFGVNNVNLTKFHIFFGLKVTTTLVVLFAQNSVTYIVTYTQSPGYWPCPDSCLSCNQIAFVATPKCQYCHQVHQGVETKLTIRKDENYSLFIQSTAACCVFQPV